MIRLFLRLLGIYDFDPCKSCETLKAQLEFERAEKKLLTDTLLDIMRPKVVEAPPVELNQIQQSAALFSRRRAALEERDRQQAKILKEAKHLGVPDKLKDNIVDKEIEKLEQELDVSEAQGE